MSHFKIRLFMAAAFALTAGAYATGASAEESGFMALFEEATPADAQDYSATYGGGQQVSYGQQDETRLQRDYPATTREMVSDPTREAPGTITVDTEGRYLYLSMANGRAMRYGIGVGRDGFTWKGRVHIGRKEAWPDWTPPKDMLKRRPDLPRHMAGGEENPLGARAMYLYSGGKDTMFRIHGSNEPWTIGQAVSSGCIRMTNDDVTDLFSRVKVGTAVVVL
ncbi:L,D-transpeptidase [Methylocystis parvus]|uniref:L,D-transpeptidase n=1 Tax=Methylocystis parvus TaxID=134 RepID=A0A6B8MAZ0_9HYPH|nr:L,D-transpeptidase [Methylocystis parvus]QGM98912.1 L,D-transpeptidase [Methylocystis parvus]WBK00732.1 L,D-transpeptidase [Methylocystis parvus OBBP]